MRVPPKAYDGVSDSVREEYGQNWASLSYRPSLPPMKVWPASSEFSTSIYKDNDKLLPVDESNTPKK